MNDRPPLNETETETEAEARRLLVGLAQSMLSKELSFFEGSVQVLHLKTQVGGIKDSDEDFNAFVVIESETDHLPLKNQRHLWSSKVLARLEPEFIKNEEWATTFAIKACTNIIARFTLSDETF
jgi:hypothetical protein